jgi:hypothetical protein
MPTTLTKQALADAYAEAYRLDVERVSGEAVPHGVIGARDLGGGWIEIYGSGIPPHKDLRAMYPNGWCLGDTIRYGKARTFIATDPAERGY